ncbi:MAG: four helix bundle protein, partial [Clostridia bacterium]|nr:four helix bundle protein [Clostridia bacterium]
DGTALDTLYDPDPPADLVALKNGAARKPYRLTDFDPPHDKEMAVFTHAKKLSEYIFVITERSPKKLRWSIITRLQNASVDVIENLYLANYERDEEKRVEYQKLAMVSLNIVDFFATTAKSKQAINIRQTAIISKQLTEVRKLLTGWVKSTKRGSR